MVWSVKAAKASTARGVKQKHKTKQTTVDGQKQQHKIKLFTVFMAL